MDLIFVSNGAYKKEIECFFCLLKSKYENIRRIHGLTFDNAKLIAKRISESEEFLFIDVTTRDIIDDISFNSLCSYYEKLNKNTIEDWEIPYNKSHPDILYLTYSEDQAEENFAKLLQKYPNIKRLHRVHGLYNAIKTGAHMMESLYYIMIDGDNDVLDDFDLNSIEAPLENQMNFYMTINAVNDLVYGYGGIKSCPTHNFRNVTNDKIDATASGNLEKVKGIKQIASITRFNTSPFDAWKAGFRECVMLVNQDNEFKMNNEKIRQKLDVWQNKGADREFGQFTIWGALDGEKYGRQHCGDKTELFKINDPAWLKATFIRLGYTTR